MSAKNGVRLDKFGFAPQTVARVKPIFERFVRGETREAEAGLGQMTLDLLDELRAGKLWPKTVDDHFTLLDLALDEALPDLRVPEAVNDLVFEGMILHDLGQPYGADLELMGRLAQQLVRRNGNDKRVNG